MKLQNPLAFCFQKAKVFINVVASLGYLSYFLQSQTTYLYDKEGANCLMDFIIKFENIDNDFVRVSEKLMLPNKKLAHLNIGDSYNNLLRGIKKIGEYPMLLRNINISKNKTHYQ